MSEKKDYRKMKNAPLQKRANVILKLNEKTYKFVRNKKEACCYFRHFLFDSISNKDSSQMFKILASTF
jgi:hypothetical protein